MGHPVLWFGFGFLAVPGLAAGARVLGVPDVIFAAGDLIDAAAGDDGVGLGVGDGRGGGWTFEVVMLLDEQPVGFGLGAAGAAAHADERPFSFELRAVEDEIGRAHV